MVKKVVTPATASVANEERGGRTDRAGAAIRRGS